MAKSSRAPIGRARPAGRKKGDEGDSAASTAEALGRALSRGADRPLTLGAKSRAARAKLQETLDQEALTHLEKQDAKEAREKLRADRARLYGTGGPGGGATAVKTDSRGIEYRRNKRGQLIPMHYRYQPNDKASRDKRKERFLEVFARTGSASAAGLAIGAGRSTHWTWRQADPAFAEAFQEIYDTHVDRLEEGMLRRATRGVVQPVYQLGSLVGAVRVYDHKLGQFMLSRLRPATFGDQPASSISPDEFARAVRERVRAQEDEARAALAAPPADPQES